MIIIAEQPLRLDIIFEQSKSDHRSYDECRILLDNSRQVELIFPPDGGIKGGKVIVSILERRDEKLPVTLLNSD